MKAPMPQQAKNRKWRLYRRLAYLLALATLVPSLLFTVGLVQDQWRSARQVLWLNLDANARFSAGVIEDELAAQTAALMMLADQVEPTSPRAGEALSRLLDAYPALLRARAIDAEGRVRVARDSRGRPLAQRVPEVAGMAWFDRLRDQVRPEVSGVQRQLDYGDEAVVTLAVPVVRDGRFVGVLEAAIPVASLARRPADSLRQRGLWLLLLDQHQRVIHAEHELAWQVMDDTGRVGLMLAAVAAPVDRPVQVRRDTGLLRTGAVAYVGAVRLQNGWVLAVVAPEDALLGPLLPKLWLLGAALAVTVMGMLLAIWRQRRILGDGIGYLLATLRGYALGGHMEPISPGRLPEELQPLAEGISELGTRMNAAFAELRQALEEREAVIAARTDSLRRAVAELDRLSRTDALTGSLNYRGFTEAGQRLWQESQASGKPLSVLALDIDYFKRYNDLYGHAAGDGALRRFAGAVRSALLHADDVLARPGGEEFTVFLPATSHAQAMRVAERVRKRVHEADIIHAGSPKGRLTVSVGVATRAPSDMELEDLLKRADAALYRAKDAGRDAVSD